eukprot:m.43542 g.43542  ORF g.43542 m.43542 type:complete len:70 (+) comp10781_c0_seq1:865-1074(+)
MCVLCGCAMLSFRGSCLFVSLLKCAWFEFEGDRCLVRQQKYLTASPSCVLTLVPDVSHYEFFNNRQITA